MLFRAKMTWFQPCFTGLLMKVRVLSSGGLRTFKRTKTILTKSYFGKALLESAEVRK